MTVSIRSSLVLSAAALAVVCAGFAPAEPETAPATVGEPNLCTTGQQQSPVDLGGAIGANAAPPQIAWETTRGAWIANTGQTLQLEVANAGGVTLDGVAYALESMHLHHPAEHTIGGKSFPLEAHLIHAAADGRRLELAVLFETGAGNAALDPIWATAPARPGKAAVAFAFSPAELVGTDAGFFRYEGSLTEPPCSETVTWLVAAKPATVSASQIAALAMMFPENAREAQPLNRRYVLKTLN